MEKPPQATMEKSLAQVVWEQMTPTDDPKVRLASSDWIAEIHAVGAVDGKRVRLPQWQAAFASLPKDEEGRFQVGVGEWARIGKFLFAGNIKKPFEPPRLKDGARPTDWLSELFQKVLRFETTLSFDAWKKLVAEQIQPRFVKGDRVQLNPALKALLGAILEKHPSPLRKLELWYLEKSQAKAPAQADAAEQKPASLAKAISNKDTFQSGGRENQSIDKLYYHHEQHPALDDKESLDFLDELASLEGEDKETL